MNTMATVVLRRGRIMRRVRRERLVSGMKGRAVK